MMYDLCVINNVNKCKKGSYTGWESKFQTTKCRTTNISKFKNFPMLKVTKGPVIRFFYLRNWLFVFSNHLNTQVLIFFSILTLQFFIIFQI